MAESAFSARVTFGASGWFGDGAGVRAAAGTVHGVARLGGAPATPSIFGVPGVAHATTARTTIPTSSGRCRDHPSQRQTRTVIGTVRVVHIEDRARRGSPSVVPAGHKETQSRRIARPCKAGRPRL